MPPPGDAGHETIVAWAESQVRTAARARLNLLIQVLPPPLLRVFRCVEHQQELRRAVAEAAPAVGLVGLEHQAVPRLQLIRLTCDPVLDLPLQAEDKLFPEVHDRIGPRTGAWRQRDQEGLHARSDSPSARFSIWI